MQPNFAIKNRKAPLWLALRLELGTWLEVSQFCSWCSYQHCVCLIFEMEIVDVYVSFWLLPFFCSSLANIAVNNGAYPCWPMYMAESKWLAAASGWIPVECRRAIISTIACSQPFNNSIRQWYIACYNHNHSEKLLPSCKQPDVEANFYFLVSSLSWSCCQLFISVQNILRSRCERKVTSPCLPF